MHFAECIKSVLLLNIAKFSKLHALSDNFPLVLSGYHSESLRRGKDSIPLMTRIWVVDQTKTDNEGLELGVIKR